MASDQLATSGQFLVATETVRGLGGLGLVDVGPGPRKWPKDGGSELS